MQTLIRRCVGDAAAVQGLHFLHMSQGPFLRDAGHLEIDIKKFSFWKLPSFYILIQDNDVMIDKKQIS